MTVARAAIDSPASPASASAAPASSAATAGDGDLLAAAAGGDRDALGELARRYVDFVYAAAVRQTGDRHAAEDVTQAVFLVLAKKAGRVRGAALASWLHRTTGYAAANARRAARRRRTHEHAAARPESVMPTTIDDSDVAALVPLLDAAVASLRTKDRQAVIDRYLRGRDLAAVAAALDATPAATQKRLERSAGRLRAYFARHGVAAGPVLPVAVTGALLSAASSSSASPALVAALSTSIATPAAASATSIATAQGVLRMLTATKLKFAAAALLAALAVGAGVEGVRRLEAAAPPVSPDAAAGSGGAAATADVDAAGDASPGGVTLPDGTRVSIAGIARLDARDRVWGPDGRPVGVRWHVPTGAGGIRRSDGATPRPQFGIVVDLHGRGDEPPTLTSFGFDGGFGADGVFTPRVAGDALTPHLDGVVSSFKPDQTTATMSFDVAAGPYRPPATQPTVWGSAGEWSASSNSSEGHYVVGKPFLRDGALTVTVSYTIGDVQKRLRVRWVDRRGREAWVTGRIDEGTSAGPVVQEVFEFPGVDDLRRVPEPPVMEFRPVRQVVFRNVSLRPGVTTNVTGELLPLPTTAPATP